MSIEFDYFSISLLIGGFTALLSGFVVFIHNRSRMENIAWLLSNMTSAIWSFGYFTTITSTSHDISLISDWVLHFAASLIPVSHLLSVLSITGEYAKHKVQFFITFAISFVFLMLVPTKLFVLDVIPKAHFNFVPDAGPAYIYFTIFFFFVVLYTLYFVFKKLKVTEDPVQRARLKYIILFTILGFSGGGSVFFLTFNINILPYPLILFSIYPAVSGYAIFRYQLFDVKVITTEILVFVLWIILLIRTLLSSTLYDGLINGSFLIFMVIAGIFLIRSIIKEINLAKEIKKIDEELKVANQGQVNLIRFMNHQVKGRLGNVKNIFAELLTDDYGTMPEESKSLLKKGLEEANLGVNYVQSILKGASAENGTLSYEMKPLDFKNIAETVAQEQKSFAESKGLYFNINVVDGDYSIIGDRLNLSEAIKNLIDNSIHYTLEGGIEINLESKEKTVVLYIKDTGIGISDNDKERLFKSGGRGEESLKINVNSTGYGLAFVKGVIESHKGKVWAESGGKGKGSTFIIELPKQN